MQQQSNKQIKIAQLATAIDAEGNVGIYRQRQRRHNTKEWRYYYNPSIVLTNTNYEWLEYFKDFIGYGTLGLSNISINNRKIYKLTWRCRQAYKIAKMVKSWIIIKKQRIKDIIDWYDGDWRNTKPIFVKKMKGREIIKIKTNEYTRWKKVPNDVAKKFLMERGLYIKKI